MDNAIAVEADGLALRVYSVTPQPKRRRSRGARARCTAYRESLLGAAQPRRREAWMNL